METALLQGCYKVVYKVVARLLQGCCKVITVSIAYQYLGCNKVVATLCFLYGCTQSQKLVVGSRAQFLQPFSGQDVLMINFTSWGHLLKI